MSESSQRATVIRALRPLHGVPVENPVQPGTPDVNYIDGWIELKWLRRWPRRPDSLVKLPHFTRQQRRWLRQRWERGGAAWLLLQAQREWLLFSGPTAAEHVGHATREELYHLARAMWRSGLDKKELVQCLQLDRGNWGDLRLERGSWSPDGDLGRHRPRRLDATA